MKIKNIIVFENKSVVALNKPPGILSIPDREGKEFSLKTYLAAHYDTIYTVHRLDRETSGLILFAKTPEAHKHFSQQFEERKTEKIYLGLLVGALYQAEGSITAPIAENNAKCGTMIAHKRGKTALTDYKLLKSLKGYSWVQFQIHTGRTHQIRVHAKELGNAIAVDAIYGDGKPVLLSALKSRFKLGKNVLEEPPLLSRLALHALRLKIMDENMGWLELEAPLHKDLKVTVAQLEKYSTSK